VGRGSVSESLEDGEEVWDGVGSGGGGENAGTGDGDEQSDR